MATSSTAISSTGIGSGLDVSSLVTKLMSIERQPETLMDNKTADFKAKLSAYGQVSSALATLQSAAGSLSGLQVLRGVSATVADSSLASATASAGTAAGTYALEVQKLAQAQSLASSPYASTLTTVGSGTLTIDFGAYSGGAFSADASKPSATITIGAGQDSLSGVRDAINAAKAGVTASIVNDGSGQRLVLASQYTGASGAMRISVVDADLDNTDTAGLSALAYDASTGGTANLTQATAAQDAKAVVNGITVTSATNSLSGAIEGVTLNLAKASPGTSTTVTVARNTASAAAAVQSFVSAYNTANSMLSSLSAYNAETKTGAVLQGDSTVRSLQARLRATIGTTVANSTGYGSLSEIGIAFQKDGSLVINSTKLNAALADPAKDAASVFAAVGTPSDSLVTFGSAGTSAVAGSYALTVSQLATHGAAVGSAPAALTITAGANDTLDLSVDGIAASVTLTAGTYTATSLAAMVQSRVNGSAALVAAGNGIEASASGGVLTLTSRRWGSNATVSVTGGTAVADVLGTPASSAGQDAAGTLGGVAATGAGQTLTAKGLTVGITGGVTGARGTLNFSRGVADSLNTLVNSMLTGPLAARTSGIQSSISDLAHRRAAFAQRMTGVEAAMRAQFIALDKTMTSMQNTSSFLTQQLDALSKLNSQK